MSKTRKSAAILAFLFMAVCGNSVVYGAEGKGVLVITKDGEPKSTILKSADASEVVGFAARELQKYVQRISGAKLPIHNVRANVDGPAIVLGTAKLDSPKHGFDRDSFTIKSEGNRLRLTGNTDRAVLYAVYAFIESLGVAWLEPGEAGELLPHKPTIAVDKIDLAFKPGFDLRGYDIYGDGTDQQKDELVDWMAKIRMNLLLHRGSINAEMKKRGFIIQAGWHSWVDDRTSDSYDSGCPGLGPDWDKDPTNFQYIAMLDGKRQMPPGISGTYLTGKARTQLCASNQEGVNKVLDNAMKYIEARPWIDIYAQFPADSMNCWCECEECLKRTPTDLYVNFANQLAARVKNKWPQKKVMFLAYFDTIFPPKEIYPDESLDNMLLFFCPIGRRYIEPFVSGHDAQVRMEYPRNKMKYLGDVASAAILRAWRKAFNGPILLFGYEHWDYPRGRMRNGYLLFPSPELTASDMRYLKRLDVTGRAPVQPPARWFPYGFDNYLYGKLLWDPSQDVGELQRQYCEQFYGSCAEAARKCLTSMAAVLDTNRDDAESVKKLNQAADTFAAELAACEKSPLIAERMERIRLWAKYVILRKEYYRCVRSKDQQAVDKAGSELVDFIEANRPTIQRYQWVDILIPKTILQRKKALREETGMAIEDQPGKSKKKKP